MDYNQPDEVLPTINGNLSDMMVATKSVFGYVSDENTVNEHYEFVKRFFVLAFIIAGILGSCLNTTFICCLLKDDEDISGALLYIYAAGFCEFLLSSISITLVGMVIQSDILRYCKHLHTFTETVVYTYCLIMLISCLHRIVKVYKFKRLYCILYVLRRACIVIVLIVIVSFVTAYVGVFYDLDYDYCQREHTGNIYFRATTNAVFYVINTLVTIVVYNMFVVTDENGDAHLKFSTNIYNYTVSLIYFGSWCPHLILLYLNPHTDDIWLTLTLSMALLRSCFWSNFLY